jgi:hypothetical protein
MSGPTIIPLVDQDVVRRREKTEAERTLAKARALTAKVVECNRIALLPAGNTHMERMEAAVRCSKAIEQRANYLTELLEVLA